MKWKTLAFAGLLIWGSFAPVIAQEVQAPSYDELVRRLQAVEQQVAAQNQAPVTVSRESVTIIDEAAPALGNGGGAFVTYESVWVVPVFSNNNAFAVFDLPGGPGENVSLQTMDWDLEYSPRLEIGYVAPGSGVGLRARYWHFDQSATAQANDPGVGRIAAGLHNDPDIEIETSDGEFLRARHEMQMEVVDVELMLQRQISSFDVTFTGGVRWANNEQSYRAEVASIATGVIDELVESEHFFQGVGPTFSIEGFHQTFFEPVSLFAKARGSLLFGESGLNQRQIDPQAGNPVTDEFTSRNELDLQFIGEVQAGLQYSVDIGERLRLFARVAAEYQFWPSGGTGAHMEGEDDGTGADPRDADLGFFGLIGAFGVDY